MPNRNAVFVIDIERDLCNPVHPAAARKLLSHGKAAVFRQYPFTIILKEKNADSSMIHGIIHQRRISFSKSQCENATRTQFALHSQATAMC